jgi:L-alanine-DL-glutamate epimerase-like enolase superfamily enzyme
MKITDIQVTVIVQKLAEEFCVSQSAITHIHQVMVEVFTDEGIVGIGEGCWGIPERTGRATLDCLKPRLIGKDPLETDSLWENMFAATYELGWRKSGFSREDIMHAMAGIDIALWDIKGKAAGMPIYKLLGGTNKPQPFYSTLGYYFNSLSPNQQGERIAKFVRDLGLGVVKVKIGRDLKLDLERVKAVRQALGPKIGLMLDANLGYDVNTAIEAGKRFLEYDIYWYEEPVHWYDRYKGLGKVADAVPIPLHAGESEEHRFQCRDLVVDGKIKYCSYDSTRNGGVTEWLKVAHFCNIHNVLMAPHCQPEIHSHLMAAVSNASILEVHPDEVRHPLWDHGYVDRAVVKDNLLYPTEKPGFGLEISKDYLKKYGTQLT